MHGTWGKIVGCVLSDAVIVHWTDSERATPELRGRCPTATSNVPVVRHVQLPVLPIPSALPCGVLHPTTDKHARDKQFSTSAF